MINKYMFGYMSAWSCLWGLDAIFDIINPIHIPKLGMVLVMWFLVEEKK